MSATLEAATQPNGLPETFEETYNRMTRLEPRAHIIQDLFVYQDYLERQANGEVLPEPTDEEKEMIGYFHNVIYDTFMTSQGRQHVQPQLIDNVWRMLTEARFELNDNTWNLLGGGWSRQKFRERRIPHGHRIIEDEQQEALFEFWLQMGVWMGRYQTHHDADQLPTFRELRWFHYNYLEQTPADSSSIWEEISGMHTVFEEYREFDPRASMSADEAVIAFSLPAMIRGDRHWIANPPKKTNQAGRKRDHTLDKPAGRKDPHHSVIKIMLATASERLQNAEKPVFVDYLYAHMCDWLDYIGALPGSYEEHLPEYARLIEEYNAAHVGNEVKALHRKQAK